MPKNITVTNIDSITIDDMNNMTSPKQVKMIHEREFESYGIDPKKVYEKSGMLKTLKPEWIPEIINENINSIKIARTHHNFNGNERSFILSFETPENCDNFYKQFTEKLFKITNNFIVNKKEKPEIYNRIIILEITTDGCQLIIRY